MLCGDCCHWRNADKLNTDGAAVGTCHRFPPTVGMIVAPSGVIGGQPQAMNWTARPGTSAYDHCGEYLLAASEIVHTN